MLYQKATDITIFDHAMFGAQHFLSAVLIFQVTALFNKGNKNKWIFVCTIDEALCASTELGVKAY